LYPQRDLRLLSEKDYPIFIYPPQIFSWHTSAHEPCNLNPPLLILLFSLFLSLSFFLYLLYNIYCINIHRCNIRHDIDIEQEKEASKHAAREKEVGARVNK